MKATQVNREFLSLIDKAVVLGLKVKLHKDKSVEISLSSTSNTLTVYAQEYQILSENGYGCGHEIVCVYTIEGAKAIKKLVDLNITDTNKKRSTLIKPRWAFYEKEDLTHFINLRKKEQRTL